MRQQQFGEQLAGPAATGQFGIERGEAGRRNRGALPAELVRMPQRRVQAFGFDRRRAGDTAGSSALRNSRALARQSVVPASFTLLTAPTHMGAISNHQLDNES
jgi:hypothetical protein